MGWEERRQACLPVRIESWSSKPPSACLKADLQSGFVEGRVLLSEGLVLVGGQHPLLSGLTHSTSPLEGFILPSVQEKPDQGGGGDPAVMGNTLFWGSLGLIIGKWCCGFTGCPVRLCCLHPWRYLRPDWIKA